MPDLPVWKDDFPVSWPDDHVVNRRAFTRTLLAVSCASFAATAGLSVRAFTRDGGESAPIRIADVSELPVGGSKVFGYPTMEEPCLLVRSGADTFVAYSQRCTHLGCPVVYELETRRLHCPCHEGFFDAKDGRVLAGPPPRPLPRIVLERRGPELWAVGVAS